MLTNVDFERRRSANKITYPHPGRLVGPMITTQTTADGLAVVTGMGWRYFKRVGRGPRGGRVQEYQIASSLTQEQPDTALPWWPKLAQAFDHRPPSTDPPREVPDQVRLVLELLAWRDSPLTPPPQ